MIDMLEFIGEQVGIAAIYIFTLCAILHFCMSCPPGWQRRCYFAGGILAGLFHALVGCLLILDFWAQQ